MEEKGLPKNSHLGALWLDFKPLLVVDQANFLDQNMSSVSGAPFNPRPHSSGAQPPPPPSLAKDFPTRSSLISVVT